jgi:hypothetical protein
MKKTLIILLVVFAAIDGYSQVVGETTIKRFSVGTDIFTDIWMNQPEGTKARFMQQGASVFGMYNYQFGKSNVSFAFGFGGTFHNFYSNSTITNIKADTITFAAIPDSVNYKKSKLGLTYLDIPFEFRLKTAKKFRVSLGFKVGVLLDGKTKYKGDRSWDHTAVIAKEKPVSQLERWRYGPTIRIGYDWFNLYGYFSLSKVFQKYKGPELYPVSVGITFLPF